MSDPIDLCEVTPLCTETATWACKLVKASGAVGHPVKACSEHRRALELEAVESRQTVRFEPIGSGPVGAARGSIAQRDALAGFAARGAAAQRAVDALIGDAGDVDTSNRFAVGVRAHGDQTLVVLAPPRGEISHADAINLAAWLVALVPGGRARFDRVLRALEAI